MTNDKQIETRILNELSYDELLSRKIESQIAEERGRAKTGLKSHVSEQLAEVDAALVFTTATEWLLFNRKTQTESVINGAQLEGILGLDERLRTRVKRGEAGGFLVGDYYIKFKAARLKG